MAHNTTIVFMVKMESVSKITIFCQKIKVNGAIKFRIYIKKIIFTDFIRFLLKITNQVTKKLQTSLVEGFQKYL